MQRQLEQLVRLPATIRDTLAAVSGKISALLPREAEEAGEEGEVLTDTDADSEAGVRSDDSDDILEEDITESIEIITEEDSSDMEALQHPASQSDSEPASSPAPRTPTPQPPTEQQQEKLAKVQKLESLNKSWPWADGAKPVYNAGVNGLTETFVNRIAEHYEPVYARCINNKVKWLEQKITEEKIISRRIKGM